MTRGGGGGAADEEKGVVTTTVVKQSDKGGVVIPNATTSSIARFMMVIVCLFGEECRYIFQCVDRYFIYHNLFLSSWKFSSFCGWCVIWCGYLARSTVGHRM